MTSPDVDRTSTSLTKREALERDIAKRSARRSLERRGIMKAGGRLASQRSALHRELVKDNVSRQIVDRPDYADLVETGIAPPQEVAPSLQAAAKLLERNLRARQLNQHLYDRADIEELRGVMPAGHVAPALRSAHIALEKAFTRDHLNGLLSSRPDPEELVQKNILKSKVAPALQSASQRLQRQMTEDKLNNMLEARERNSDLRRENIVPDSRVASTLQSAQRDLQRNLTKSNLYHALQSRPTRSELEERGVLYADEDEIVVDSTRHAYAQTHHQPSAQSNPFQRRSRNFVLTRLLLKFVANLGEAGEISMQQKGFLKDLIVDQDPGILAAAEVFEADGQIDEFKDSLLRFSLRSDS